MGKDFSLQMLVRICVAALVIQIAIAESLAFWQISDTHADHLYAPNTLPINLSCRFGVGNAGLFGDYNCDPPLLTQSEVIRQMKQAAPNPQFILHTGDSQHNEALTVEEASKSIRNCTEELRKNFPGVPIIYAIGNHDLVPKDSILPDSSQLAQIADIFKDYLTPQQLSTFRRGGYYSTRAGGYRILLLNTMLYYRWNQKVSNITYDIGGQFQFIQDELVEAEKNQERVLVVSHVAPGKNEYDNSEQFWPHFNKLYTQVFENKPDIVKAHFYGHNHFDSFRLTADNGVVFLSPSLTTSYQNNIGAGRLYRYDSKTQNLISFQQYYVRLDKANRDKQLSLELEYDTSAMPYRLPDLSLQSFTTLIDRMKADSSLFTTFIKFKYLGISNDCSTSCKKLNLCTMKSIDIDMIDRCLEENSHPKFLTPIGE